MVVEIQMDWMSVLRNIAFEVRNVTLPFFGAKEARVPVRHGAGGHITEKIDAIAEDMIVRILRQLDEPCILVSEEAGTKKFGENPDTYIVVDPIDGTTNATRGIPFFATSLAISNVPRLSGVTHGLVMDLFSGATFCAEKGRGATLNGKQIKPSQASRVDEAVIGVDLSTPGYSSLRSLIPLLARIKYSRHLGANALELCYVAAGISDAFIDIRKKLRVTDVAAAHFILKEAGGVVVTPDGKTFDADLKPTQRVAFIAAANHLLLQDIQRHMKINL
ncbi:MAG: inositol monophosphatase family protein [Candidatus Bathyarchaeia archaeon]